MACLMFVIIPNLLRIAICNFDSERSLNNERKTLKDWHNLLNIKIKLKTALRNYCMPCHAGARWVDRWNGWIPCTTCYPYVQGRAVEPLMCACASACGYCVSLFHHRLILWGFPLRGIPFNIDSCECRRTQALGFCGTVFTYSEIHFIFCFYCMSWHDGMKHRKMQLFCCWWRRETVWLVNAN